MFAPPRTPPRRPVVALFIAGIVTIPLPACTSSAATEPDGGSPSIEVNPKIELSYKPTGLPIHIIVDSNGNIEVTSDPFVTVPIPFLGTVSAGIALEPNTNTNNTENGLLTIRLNGQDHLYDIGKEDVNILFEEGYFSQTRVITRGQDVLIVLERSVTPAAQPTTYTTTGTPLAPNASKPLGRTSHRASATPKTPTATAITRTRGGTSMPRSSTSQRCHRPGITRAFRPPCGSSCLEAESWTTA